MLRPKDIKKPIYWIHILLIVVILEVMMFLFASSIASSLGFTPQFNLLNIILSKITVVGTVMLGLADIASHSILGID